jgi:hypothetical protein
MAIAIQYIMCYSVAYGLGFVSCFLIMEGVKRWMTH